MPYKSTFILLFFCFGLTLQGQNWTNIPKQAEELGYVNWSRSYDDALVKAQKENKAVFILFQEVPGCSTCKNYGNNLLTHPHIVEAIETYFIPLAIFNNKGGSDVEILRKFGEPSWNNPVARIIDPKSEKDIVPRLNGRYDMDGLISTLMAGILASNKLIPNYLDLLQQEYAVQDLRETHLSMYCFWSGEKNLGQLEGVVSTRAGFMNGAEVVKVKYDAEVVKEKDLLSFAASKQCADGVFTNDQREVKAAQKLKIRTKKEGKFRTDSQPKYYTYNTPYKYLPMTDLQALKVNSALSSQMSPDDFLSPRQKEIFKTLRNKKDHHKNVIDSDFASSWYEIIRRRA